MRVSDEAINNIINDIENGVDYGWSRSEMIGLVKERLQDDWNEQNQRIAESLLSTDDVMPAFLKNQAE